MLQLSLFSRAFGIASWPQVPANQGFTNGLSSVRCSEFSLSLAHSNEFELLARIEGPGESLNHRRNALFRHRSTPFQHAEYFASPCQIGTYDKCKSDPFVEITPWFTPISGIPTGIFVPFVGERTEY